MQPDVKLQKSGPTSGQLPSIWPATIVGVAAIFGMIFGAHVLSDFRDWRRAAQERAELEHPVPDIQARQEAIVVLTGDYARIPRALQLMQKRGSAFLLISGAAKGIDRVELLRQQGADQAHVREFWERILVEARSTTTRENAYEAERLLRQRGIRNAILVTSDYHLARALSIFRRVAPGLNVTGYPVDSNAGRSIESVLWRNSFEFWKYFLDHHSSERIDAMDLPNSPNHS